MNVIDRRTDSWMDGTARSFTTVCIVLLGHCGCLVEYWARDCELTGLSLICGYFALSHHHHHRRHHHGFV